MMETKVGLSISGGGAKGAAALSIIQELMKANVNFSAVSGTSIGAFIGAYYLTHKEMDSLAQKVLSMSSKEWITLLDWSIKNKRSVVKGIKIKAYLDNVFGEKTFEDIDIPLIIPATDLEGGTITYFESGKISDAVMASVSYPGVLPPFSLNGKIYADGGILDNLPYKPLFSKGVDKVVAINLNKLHGQVDSNFSTISSVVIRSLDLVINNNTQEIKDSKVFVFSPTFKNSYKSLWDVSGIKDGYASGLTEYKDKEHKFLDWINT